MTASQAHHPRAGRRLRQWFKSRTGKQMSQKDLFTESLAGAGMRSYMVMPGQPVWMDRNYYQFALEAYIKNVIAHRAMGMVSGCASSVRLKLYERDAGGIKIEIKAHPILDMLHHPNPAQGHGEFFQALHQYRLISGNAFIQAVGPSDAPPRELHLLRPDRMAVIAGIGTMPSGYRYTVNGDYTDYPVDRYTGRSQILHLRNFHPLNDWYGLSPVEAAAYSIDQHNQAGAWNQALLQNGARPSGALVVSAESTGGGTLSEEQYNRIKLQIDDQFSGAVNAGRPILLEGGLEWKEMSINPKDMDFVQAKNSSARDIALAFGVPPQMLGIPGDNTYSNLQEARLALWEQTVIPLVRSTTDALNGWLAPMFGSDLELEPDTAGISALATKNQALWNMVETANFLTVDEKRAATGYGPLPQPSLKKKAKIRREIKIGTRRIVKDWGDDADGGNDFPNYPDDSDNNTDSDAIANLQAEDPPIDSVYPIESAIGALAGGEAIGALGEAAGLGEGAGMAAEDAAALADKIASGHAFDDHVIDDGQFPDITTPEEFSDHIQGILTDPDDYKDLLRDRSAYWDDESGTVVIHDPNNEDGGTAFVPDTGKDFFDTRLK